jgi:hypothetical protein
VKRNANQDFMHNRRKKKDHQCSHSFGHSCSNTWKV